MPYRAGLKQAAYHPSSLANSRPENKRKVNEGMTQQYKVERKTKLQRIRKARRMTQQELSEASGVTLRMIQLYEQRQNDINKAQVSVVVSLARALGCQVEDLLE